MEIAQLSGASIELRITSDQGVAALHRRYMGGVGPTNVLSFPTDASDPEDGLLGSIIISADAVIREACLYQQDAADHFIRLLTHALLHLADFEHGTLMDEITEHVVEQMQTARNVQQP